MSREYHVPGTVWGTEGSVVSKYKKITALWSRYSEAGRPWLLKYVGEWLSTVGKVKGGQGIGNAGDGNLIQEKNVYCSLWKNWGWQILSSCWISFHLEIMKVWVMDPPLMRWLMASPTRWTWVWVNSGSWQWTGRPGVLWFMGLQRVRSDWATELNWRTYYIA